VENEEKENQEEFFEHHRFTAEKGLIITVALTKD
jgi:hypothetical protein